MTKWHIRYRGCGVMIYWHVEKNSTIIQKVLSKGEWKNTLTTEDLRALTPLIYNHTNPYDNFELNMDERIPILK